MTPTNNDEDWSERFSELTDELERIEGAVNADEMHVATRSGKTDVTLVYRHDESGG